MGRCVTCPFTNGRMASILHQDTEFLYPVVIFLKYDPATAVQQNKRRIHIPYKMDVPSRTMELKTRFTTKADTPVFNPIRRWLLSTLLTTIYPAIIPPRATISIESISSSRAGVRSDHKDLAT